MKFIINGKAYVKKYKTGVQRYCIEILKELDKIVDKESFEIVVPKYCEELELKNIKVVKYGKLSANLWEQIELPLYVKKKQAILVNLSNTSPILCPDIVCIHDINFIKNKQYYPKLFSFWYNIMVKNACKKAKKIITVSNFSKNEIENWYGRKDIKVIYNSYEHIYRIKSKEDILEKLNLEKEKYFFTLGTVQKSKNIRWILEVAKRNPKKVFVITGYKNQKELEIDLENVKYTGYLSDEEIKALMENCFCYIMPSLYEGFGIPPLEALALGRTVIVSDIPVMHEIFENEVQYLNPLEYDINLNKIYVGKDREKILEKFSWKESAIKLLNIIHEVEK